MEFDMVLNDTALNGTYNLSLDHYCQYNPEDPFCMYEGFSGLTPGIIISAIGIALLIVVALSGNILVCTAFFVYQRLRKTTNYFIISLALSDILVATIVMPMWLSYEVTGWHTLPPWIDYMTLIKVWHWFDILAGVSSITNLTAISIDRCLSIRMPLIHRMRMTKTIAIIMVLIAWVYGIVLASLSFLEYQYFTAIVASLGFFLPLLIIIVSYSMIYYQVKGGGYSEQDWNLEKTIIIVISVFVVCWLPFFTFSILYNYCFTCEFTPDEAVHIRSFVKWMHYLNSCFNPFIYGLFNLNFKNAFRALLQQCFVFKKGGNECTNNATNERKSSIKCQIMGLKRTLQLKRKSRGDSFLSSDANIASTTMILSSGGTACNNSDRTLECEANETHNDTALSSNDIRIPADVSNGKPHLATDPTDSLSYFYDSKHDSPKISFLHSQSQESCV